eukprot:jgi/Psemu1/28360/gm1.28360_g
MPQQQRGHRRAIVNGKIVVDPSEAMFFARSGSRRVDVDVGTSLLCGATLIHNDVLLTAAHCQGSFNYGVLLYDTETNDYTREATIDRQIRYPGFNGMDMHNDILLLRLSADPGLPIATLNSDSSIPAAIRNNANRLLALGFGNTEFGGTPSEVLREGQFYSIDNQECTERVRSRLNDPSLPWVWEDVLCADPHVAGNGNGGNSICQGDSGGPLLLAASSSSTSSSPPPLVVGVSSWSYGCEADALPDGFARVSAFYDWIQEQICFHSRIVAADRVCPEGTFPPPPNPDSVPVLLTFNHDYFPEDTQVRVLSRTKDRTTNDSRLDNSNIDQVLFAGPYYVPQRESVWTSVLHLPPVRAVPNSMSFCFVPRDER